GRSYGALPTITTVSLRLRSSNSSIRQEELECELAHTSSGQAVPQSLCRGIVGNCHDPTALGPSHQADRSHCCSQHNANADPDDQDDPRVHRHGHNSPVVDDHSPIAQGTSPATKA